MLFPIEAGVEIILPDLTFVEKIKRDLLGLIITHAHEDHIGAVAELWPRFQCPVFATPFAAALLAARLEGIVDAPDITVSTVKQGGRIALDPFDVELIPVAHSIPESCALAIRTPHGTVVHTGDWKIDPEPGLGLPTDSTRLTAIGDEGVLALVCDSTNILRDGVSPSEAEVALALKEVIGGAARTCRCHDFRLECRAYSRGGLGGKGGGTQGRPARARHGACRQRRARERLS